VHRAASAGWQALRHGHRGHAGRPDCLRIGRLDELGPLQLVQATNPESQVSRFIQHYGQGVQHVALQVNNIEGLVQRLDRRGPRFSTDIVKSPGLRQIFTKRSAQTGLMLELIERGEFSGFTDENIDSVFRQMEASGDF